MVDTDKNSFNLPEKAILPMLGDVKVDHDVVRRWLGCSHGNIMENVLKKNIDRVRDYSIKNKLIRPMAAYRILEAQKVKKTFVGMSPENNKPDSFYGKIESASFIVFAAVHISSALEKDVHRLMKEKSLVMATVLDAYGNAAIESVSNRLVGVILDYIKKSNLSMSSPFYFGSPGLPLDRIHFFENLLPNHLIEMTFTKAGGFRPTKSSCMILAIGENMPIWPKEQNCERCQKNKDCPYKYSH